MQLLKERRRLCMPIQAEIIPKYGFEPTNRGVSQVVYLTGEMPKAKAAEGATVLERVLEELRWIVNLVVETFPGFGPPLSALVRDLQPFISNERLNAASPRNYLV
eukprot:s4345_g2.t1